MTITGAQFKANAAKDWAETLSAPMRSIHIDEWGGEIFFKPANLEQKNAIYKFIAENDLSSIAETVVRRALNEDGERLFTNTDKKFFMTKVDPDTLSRIALAINEEPEVTIEEARKNSDSAIQTQP
jgi:hypothetical protein